MGCFSWFCQDTGRRIVNGEERTVYMTDNKGNSYEEKCYEGYGIFGGKDYYELLAEMNGKEADREAGIDLAYGITPDGHSEYPDGDNPNIFHPSLTEHKGWYCGGQPPKPDPNQGLPDVEWKDDDIEEEY